MNRTAFQIYGSKKTGIFQSTWNTNLTEISTTELATTATGTNWIGTSYTLGYTHTPGSTVALTSSIVSQIGFNFRLVATITNRTAGSVDISWGGTSNTGISTTTTLELLTTSTTAQLLITPTSDFDGKIAISLKCTSAPSNQLKLPLVSTGTYNFWVDWGDGTYDNITSWNQAQRIHTYASPGTYTTRITGVITGWESMQGNNYFGDRKKLISVASWGKLKPSTRGFDGCSNMTLNTVNDLLDLSHLTTMQFMFANCTALTVIGRSSEWKTSTITSLDNCFYNSINFNSPLNGWDVSNVTNMGGMFANCTNFNQNLNNWNVSKVAFFIGGPITNGMFGNCTNFNNGFASGITNQLTWTINTTSSVSMASMFANCTSFNSNLGTGTTPWDVSKVISFASMFQGASNFNNGDDSAPINNWSINTTTSVTMASMFSSAFNFNRYIADWNSSQVTDMSNMFNSAYVFNQEIGAWNMSKVTNISGMFYRAYLFDKPLAGWERSTPGDVSSLNKVTNMVNTFLDARVFNQPIGNWDTSSVTRMDGMFSRTSSIYGGPGANLFNQSIGNWNVSKVVNFTGMFYANAGAISFNNGDNSVPLDNWILNTSPSASIIMSYMFYGCPFNRYLGSWNTSRVTNMSMLFSSTPFNNGFASGVANQLTWNTSACENMSQMFQSCTAFNSNLGTGTTPWDVSKVKTFASMFSGATKFNNGDETTLSKINDWSINTVSSVSMNSMFMVASIFNRDISNWNMTKVINTGNMFSNALQFNQAISNWERSGSTTGNITIMTSMFSGANIFNQPIDNWNVSSATNMDYMFQQASAFDLSLSNWERTGSTLANVLNMNYMFQSSAFNQNIGNWNVSKVASFIGFMSTKTPATFSSTNLDAIYNGWIVNGVKPNINISFGTAKYSQAGKAGKDTLLGSPNNWTITDGLLTVSATSNNGGLIRVTTSAAHGFTTGNIVYIYGVNGTTNANGTWTVTVVSTTVIELQGSTYNAAWTSGGNVILG